MTDIDMCKMTFGNCEAGVGKKEDIQFEFEKLWNSMCNPIRYFLSKFCVNMEGGNDENNLNKI